jgi:hypothetical protein
MSEDLWAPAPCLVRPIGVLGSGPVLMEVGVHLCAGDTIRTAAGALLVVTRVEGERIVTVSGRRVDCQDIVGWMAGR